MKFGRVHIWAFALLAWTLGVCEAETSDEAKVRDTAQRFFDDYTRSILLREIGVDQSVEWLNKSSLLTPEYKRAVAKVYHDGRQEDPELGLGADVVICGQVFPEKGCEVRRVWIEGPLAFVMLSSRDPKFKHVIHARFVKEERPLATRWNG